MPPGDPAAGPDRRGRGEAKGSDVQFVGVDVLDPDAKAALAFVQAAGLTYPVGADSHAAGGRGLYALDGEPNTFFIELVRVRWSATLSGPVDRSGAPELAPSAQPVDGLTPTWSRRFTPSGR